MNRQMVAQSPKQSFTLSASGVLQRKCDKCREKDRFLQRSSVGSATETVPHIVHEVLRSPGQPLDAQTRAFMEPRFGRDFSQVRIHADVKAAESARAVNALAYTMGRNMVFDKGQYVPYTRAGKKLMAHELTHVVQQDSVPFFQPSSISSGISPLERAARENAEALDSDGAMQLDTDASFALHRQPAPGGGAPATVPHYRDCIPAITGIPDADARLEESRQRARNFVGSAIARLSNAPAAGTTYATALARHFIAPTAADRASIQATYRQILGALVVPNIICNSGAICDRPDQAFWLPDDDLLHVCHPFWGQGITCRAIIFIHESAHDVGIDSAPGAHAPNRGDANYPAGNHAPPVSQTTPGRMNNPDAYAFFAAHVWRDTDTGSTCF
jgi:hypothetical protein